LMQFCLLCAGESGYCGFNFRELLHTQTLSPRKVTSKIRSNRRTRKWLPPRFSSRTLSGSERNRPVSLKWRAWSRSVGGETICEVSAAKPWESGPEDNLSGPIPLCSLFMALHALHGEGCGSVGAVED
jgi:hypothetical protein